MTPDTDSLLGTLVAGRYRVLRRLGTGGMGAVYLAESTVEGRQVALKVLLSGLSRDTTAVKRFEHEALAASRLHHPNIVTLHEFGRTDDGLMFIVMEYLEGQSLRQVLASEKALSWQRAVAIGLDITRALVEAHAQGLVHRDLKPDNIMLTQTVDGEMAKVLDFGLAKIIGNDGARRLTETQIVMGSPGFMSPEQIHGFPLDGRSDLYAVGMLLWEMLAGGPPFPDQAPIKLLIRHAQEEIPRLSVARPGLALPAGLDELIAFLSAKDPHDRPRDALALLQALKAIVADPWRVSAGAGSLAPILGLSPHARTQPLHALPAATVASWEQLFAQLDPFAPQDPATAVVSGVSTDEFVLGEHFEPSSSAGDPVGAPSFAGGATAAAAVARGYSPPPPTPGQPPGVAAPGGLLLEPISSSAHAPNEPQGMPAVAPAVVAAGRHETPKAPLPAVSTTSSGAKGRRAEGTEELLRGPRGATVQRSWVTPGRAALVVTATLCLGAAAMWPDGLQAMLRALQQRLSAARTPDAPQKDAPQHPMAEVVHEWEKRLGPTTESAEVLIAQARVAMATGSAAGRHAANEALMRVLILDPTHIRALALLVDVRAAGPFPRQSLAEFPVDEALELAVSREPENPLVWRAKAARHFADDKLELAKADLAKARSLDPSAPETAIWSARVLAADDVLASEQAARLAAELLDGSSVADVWLGRALRAQYRFAEARAVLDGRISASAQDALARAERAALDADEGRVEQALDDFERAYRDDPEQITILLRYANLALVSGKRLTKVNQMLARADRRHREVSELVATRIQVLLSLNRTKQAHERGETAVADGAAGYSFLSALGAARRAAGDLQGARTAFLAAREQALGSVAFGYTERMLGDVALATGAFAEAGRAFERAIAMDANLISARVGLFVAGMAAKQEDLSRRVAKGILDLDPTIDRAHRRNLERRFSEAALYARVLNAIKVMPANRSLVELGRGLISWIALDDESAATAFSRTLRYDRSNPTALLLLAATELEAGKVRKASSRAASVKGLRDGAQAASLLQARSSFVGQDFEQAARLLEDVSGPQLEASAATLRAQLASARNNPELARRQYLAALALDADFVPALEGLAGLP